MKKVIFFFFIPACSCLYSQSNKPGKAPAKDTNSILKLIDSAKSLRQIDYEKAQSLAEMAKEQSVRTGFNRGEALSYSELAAAYYSKGQMPQAEELAFTAIEKLRLFGTPGEISDGTNRLGLICLAQGKYYQAEAFFQQSLKLYATLRDTAGVAIATHNLGVISYYKSEFDKAAKYYNQSLHMAEKIGDEKRINSNLLNLGLLYSTQRESGKAKSYIKRALSNHQRTNSEAGLASCWQGLGTAHFNALEFDSSLTAHQNSLIIYEKLGKQDGVAQQLCNIADIYIQQGRYDRAKEPYLRSVKIRKENNDQYGLILSYTGLANMHYAAGEQTRAQSYYDSALTVSKEINSPWKTADLYFFISDFQASSGNYKAAYEALKHYSTAMDTLLSGEKLNLVHEIEAQHENEKKEQILQNKQTEIGYLRKTNRLFVWLLISCVVIAFLIVILLAGRSRQIRAKAQRAIELEKKDRELAQAKKKEIEMELDYKKKELTQMALHISNQNEFLESFKNSLTDVSSEKQLRTLGQELKTKILIDKQREDFEMNIELIHEDFFRKLNEKFPGLTENEKKLCAMLRLNLSSKEIASVQNISVKSVEMNRYRLRKKLQLNGDEALAPFLSSI